MSRDIILPGGDTLKLFDSAYTPSEVEAILTKALRQPGRNLLINSRWDVLANIVNQRGQTEYTGAGWTIDMWRMWIASQKVSLTPNGIIIDCSSNTEKGALTQYLPLDALRGNLITISMLTSTGKLSVGTGLAGSAIEGSKIDGCYGIDSWTSGAFIAVSARANPGVTTDPVIAAQLEEGPDQTLAHKDAAGNWVLNAPPPDFGLELLKCQRYFQTFATQSQRPTKGADFRPVMRTENPTLGTITLPDGTVLYTASSEL